MGATDLLHAELVRLAQELLEGEVIYVKHFILPPPPDDTCGADEIELSHFVPQGEVDVPLGDEKVTVRPGATCRK